jgi:hypothetical protein
VLAVIAPATSSDIDRDLVLMKGRWANAFRPDIVPSLTLSSAEISSKADVAVQDVHI